MYNLISKAVFSHRLNKQEIVSLLSNDDCNEVLFKAADDVRKKFVFIYARLSNFQTSVKTTAAIAACGAAIKTSPDTGLMKTRYFILQNMPLLNSGLKQSSCNRGKICGSLKKGFVRLYNGLKP